MPTTRFLGYQRERLAHRNMVDPLTHRYPRSLREVTRDHSEWMTSVLESRFEDERAAQMFSTPPRFDEDKSWRYASWFIASLFIVFIAMVLAGWI